jgi:GNAT superfamily N-acetyltransferase
MRHDCSEVNWEFVSQTLQRVGMAYCAPEVHQKAFENSHTVVFAYHDERLIGFGRAISDNAYQAAVYDVAVVPEFQGKGVGKSIMTCIQARLSHCNIILYAAPGKENFYRKLGWRQMKTAMALFKDPEQKMRKGFTQ